MPKREATMQALLEKKAYKIKKSKHLSYLKWEASTDLFQHGNIFKGLKCAANMYSFFKFKIDQNRYKIKMTS